MATIIYSLSALRQQRRRNVPIRVARSTPGRGSARTFERFCCCGDEVFCHLGRIAQTPEVGGCMDRLSAGAMDRRGFLGALGAAGALTLLGRVGLASGDVVPRVQNVV